MAASFGFRKLWQAYLACRKGKRGTANAQRYELRLLDNLVDTATALASRAYTPSRSLCFAVSKPKAREIHAADFSDRVVHHLLVPRLEALYEPVFIHDLYSNRKGKGTHAAVERLGAFMRSLEGWGNGVVFALQLDIHNFFNSIDRNILNGLLGGRIAKSVNAGSLTCAEAEALSWLVCRLLERHPADNVVMRGHPQAFERVPPHKRLANAPPVKGLPIGNLTSQFFANVYLNELDQFVKHRLKCRHYLRYVDDFMLLHHDPAQLLVWRDEIVRFLHERLDLRLKALAAPRPVGDGVDFLGYITRPHYRLVRRRVVGNLHERLQAFEKRLLRTQGGGHTVLLKAKEREALRATLSSYLGHFRHANAWRLTCSLWRRHPWLTTFFALRQDMSLQPLWEPASVTSLRSQWRYFKQLCPNTVILMQAGNRIERYHEDANLPKQGVRQRDTNAATRHFFDATASLPIKQLDNLRKALRKAGLAHAFIAEEGHLRGGMKRRMLRWLWRPKQEIPLSTQEITQ